MTDAASTSPIGQPLTDAGLHAACEALGAPSRNLWAVLLVESSGFGFLNDRRPKVLFERHIFHRLTAGRFDRTAPDLSNPLPGGYGPVGPRQHQRLAAAMALDATAAVQAASWGLGQVLGELFAPCGYESAAAFVADARRGEDEQLLAMARLIRADNLHLALANEDWPRFARGYNGAGYRRAGYDRKLREAVASLEREGLPDLTRRAAMLDRAYAEAVSRA
ncbi:MAG: N-acetylmuramidase family protein [Pseudomonadota bacterium]|jgi:hypothetical protein